MPLWICWPSFDVEASRIQTLLRDIQDFFSKPVVRIVGVVLLLLLIFLVVWKLFLGRRRYRYGRSVGRRHRSSYRGRRRH